MVDGTPTIFWDSQWLPICAHYFWDNDVGAQLFCQKLGFESGYVNRSNSGGNYPVDSFRIGLCKENNDLLRCNGGCNDYQSGGYCGNGDVQDTANGNGGARCEKDHGPKISIDCIGGESTSTAPCLGGKIYSSKTCKDGFLMYI